MNEFRSLGKRVTEFQGLDVIELKAGLSHVTFQSDELTSRCPITNQPDYYVVTIEFEPDRYTVESKSLKLYLETFREQGIFCEHLAVRIADDIFSKVIPRSGSVTLRQKSRGGITITAVAKYPREG